MTERSSLRTICKPVIHTISYLVRVTSFGTYQMPSTKVEQMYEPEVYGQTASEAVTVE
jgi:uncharacterized protein YfaS (alpha-2-macroglobulin family)